MPETSERLPGPRFLDRRSPPNIVTLILLASVSGLALNIFLPSLPNMTAHFETEYGLMQMAVAFYLGMNAILQLIIGPISDRYGRKGLLRSWLVGYAIAGIACIMTSSFTTLLLARFIQVIFASGVRVGDWVCPLCFDGCL